jgi:hypothetical protein
LLPLKNMMASYAQPITVPDSNATTKGLQPPGGLFRLAADRASPTNRLSPTAIAVITRLSP